MIGIVELAERKDELLQENLKIVCPNCGEVWFSPFDRLFVLHTDKCSTCWDGTDDDFIRISDNVFEIL